MQMNPDRNTQLCMSLSDAPATSVCDFITISMNNWG